MPRYSIQLSPNISKVNIRTDHSKSALDIGDFLPLQTAEGDVLWQTGSGATLEKWLEIATLNGAVKSGWVCIQHPVDGLLCVLFDNNPPPPSTEPTMVEFSVLENTEVFVTPPGGTKRRVWPQ